MCYMLPSNGWPLFSASIIFHCNLALCGQVHPILNRTIVNTGKFYNSYKILIYDMITQGFVGKM